MIRYLVEDVVSSFAQNVYGLQNEEVRVISEQGDVWIVEGRSGRFPVRMHLLSEERLGPVKTLTPIERPPARSRKKRH